MSDRSTEGVDRAPLKQLTDAWQALIDATGITSAELARLAEWADGLEPCGPLPMSEHIAKHRERLAQRIHEVNTRGRR